MFGSIHSPSHVYDTAITITTTTTTIIIFIIMITEIQTSQEL